MITIQNANDCNIVDSALPKVGIRCNRGVSLQSIAKILMLGRIIIGLQYMAKGSERLTKMEELAKLAEVSVSTVSRALAGSTLINEKTRTRIVELAEKHHYQINEKARNFRLKKTNVIAVVLMLDVKSEQHISDMFFLEMLGAIADALSSREYDLLLAHTPVQNVLDVSHSRVFRQSDGIIFIGQGNQHEQLNELSQQGNPMVVWGRQSARQTILHGRRRQRVGRLSGG